MYSYIKGTLEEISEDQIVVENHGIGYNIRISARMLDVLPTRGEEIKIYTYLYVKEDAFLCSDSQAEMNWRCLNC